MEATLAIFLAALLGSIPFGLLLTRAAGLGDIRSIGSGNIGATNVLRTGNKKLAAATLLLDMLKGAAAVWLVAWIAPTYAPWAAVAAVLGHCYTPWLGFQGGKGMATALGVMLGLAWPIFVVSSLTWLAVAKLSKRSSAGSLSAIVIAPLAALIFATPQAALGLLLLGAVVVWRHKGNIQRLLAGTEPRIGQGK
ncbi:glycerol-3-phosphate 1-O-acyltransferase PlsY [Roseococcus pinisoli]|uniref:Glycerol-3-phosphate acyltransferase n=1 Tax=Roseococcus pinisoli TaxID=2835040 RepID=A0ABS5QF03_9PROT|nr:glycerol-3-phosphate 1-O-acyltransferase PlsY [Roseococcus pinisoli]MBS7812256.1 glycerol-3-phosphate 1-O-acyltransferase PlsY [Roseococcus pinisoli]